MKQATAACRVIAATLPLWPRLQRGQDRVKVDRPKGWAAEAPQPAERHDWAKGDKHWHCRKCFKHAKGVTPNGLRSRQRCKGRPDCLAERRREFGHALWETTCSGVPLLLCTTCGAWCDRTPKRLGDHCLGRRGEAGSRACRRTFTEGLHPARETLVDREPVPYHYDEEVHGPSCRTVSVRKLARQQLRRLVPWTEIASHPSALPAEDPTPEEEHYWAQLSRDFLEGDTQEQLPGDDWDQIEAPSGEDFTFFESLPELSRAEARPPHVLANRALAADLCELHRIFAPTASLTTAPTRPSPDEDAARSAHEEDPDIAELRDLLVHRNLAQQRQLLAEDPDGCAAFWAEAVHSTTGASSSSAPQHATLLHTESVRGEQQRPASLTRLQTATVRRNRASAHAKRQAKKAAARPKWNISTATSSAFQITDTSSGNTIPLEAWQRERALANREFALALKEDADRVLAPLFEATEAQELTAEQETAPPSSSSVADSTRYSLGESRANDAAPAEPLALSPEPPAEAVLASDAVSASGTPHGHAAEAVAPLLSEDDLAEMELSLRELAEMAERGEKVLWPRGYDPSDSGAAAHAARTADASSSSEARPGHGTSAVEATLSDDDLVALRDLVDMADMGAKVSWPHGLDRSTALLAITAGTAARQRLQALASDAEGSSRRASIPRSRSSSSSSSSSSSRDSSKVSPSDAPT